MEMEIIVLGFYNVINIYIIMLSNLIFFVFLKFININEIYILLWKYVRKKF